MDSRSGLESDQLITSEHMAKNLRKPRYRAVGANGMTSEACSSTDDEMIDITTDAPFEYTDLADRSQGKFVNSSSARTSY